MKIKYQQDISSIVEELVTLSQDAKLAEKIGSKNAKELADKVNLLRDGCSKAPEDKKALVLLGHLESIKEWSQDKEKESKNSVFSKIGSIVSSYAKAVWSWFKGGSKAATEHKFNASQAIKELSKGKQISQELGSVQEQAKKIGIDLVKKMLGSKVVQLKTKLGFHQGGMSR